MHENMNRVVRSGNTVVSTTTNQQTANCKQNCYFFNTCNSCRYCRRFRTFKHIRVKNEIERLEQQLEKLRIR